MDINSNNEASCYYDLVPIALGKYLLPFRTQKSSPVAPIILLLRETRKVPNYRVGLSREKVPTKELRTKDELEVNPNSFFDV